MGRISNAAIVAEDEWSKWYLLPEGKNSTGEPILRIKRYRVVTENGKEKTKWQRYPAQNYVDLPKDEVDALLRRINASHEIDRKNAEDRYNFAHTYINEISKEKFRRQLDKKSRDEGHKGHVMQILNEYVLEFFVIQCNVPDPSRWHLKEDDWKEFLLMHDFTAGYLKRIVGTANRFNNFLVSKVYPEMATPRKLEPFGKVEFDDMEKQRKGETNRTKYIKPEVYEKILKAAKDDDPEVLPHMVLAKHFGFRIGETQGLTKDKFYEDDVLCDEQGDKVVFDTGKKSVSRKKVKTDARNIPYWFMGYQEAWELVKQVNKTPMHPDQLIKRVNEVMDRFGHSSHDFRRTFITDSFRKGHHWKDVMKAAGHKDVRTTMIYNQDDRGQSKKKANLAD